MPSPKLKPQERFRYRFFVNGKLCFSRWPAISAQMILDADDPIRNMGHNLWIEDESGPGRQLRKLPGELVDITESPRFTTVPQGSFVFI